MELKITSRDPKELLGDYFTKKDNIEAIISISSMVNMDRYDQEECNVEIKLRKKINLLGKERIVTTSLSKEEIKEVLKAILEDSGYDVVDITFDNGINYITEGYGMGERIVPRAYFNGVTVIIKKHEKVKVR